MLRSIDCEHGVMDNGCGLKDNEFIDGVYVYHLCDKNNCPLKEKEKKTMTNLEQELRKAAEELKPYERHVPAGELAKILLGLADAVKENNDGRD